MEGALDHILHFASPASPIDYLRIPIQTLKVGSLGNPQLPGFGQAQRSPGHHRFYQRDLWRSRGAPAA